jgi:hypothetical protein
MSSRAKPSGASVIARPVYNRGELNKADQASVEEGLGRVQSTGLLSRKSSIRSVASSLASNPLFRSSTESMSAVKARQMQVMPEIVVVRAVSDCP